MCTVVQAPVGNCARVSALLRATRARPHPQGVLALLGRCGARTRARAPCVGEVMTGGRRPVVRPRACGKDDDGRCDMGRHCMRVHWCLRQPAVACGCWTHGARGERVFCVVPGNIDSSPGPWLPAGTSRMLHLTVRSAGAAVRPRWLNCRACACGGGWNWGDVPHAFMPHESCARPATACPCMAGIPTTTPMPPCGMLPFMQQRFWQTRSERTRTRSLHRGRGVRRHEC